MANQFLIFLAVVLEDSWLRFIHRSNSSATSYDATYITSSRFGSAPWLLNHLMLDQNDRERLKLMGIYHDLEMLASSVGCIAL